MCCLVIWDILSMILLEIIVKKLILRILCMLIYVNGLILLYCWCFMSVNWNILMFLVKSFIKVMVFIFIKFWGMVNMSCGENCVYV